MCLYGQPTMEYSREQREFHIGTVSKLALTSVLVLMVSD